MVTAETLDQTIRACDTYAVSKVLLGGPFALGLRRYAKWRKEPATPAQKAFLSKRLPSKFGASAIEGASNDKLDRLNKGDAANILTRLKHGAGVGAILIYV